MLARKFFTPIKNRARSERYKTRSFRSRAYSNKTTLYYESDIDCPLFNECCGVSQEEIYLQIFRQAKFKGSYHMSLKNAALNSMFLKHRPARMVSITVQ